MEITQNETIERCEKIKKPILVTGAIRSGTTWVGKMLTLSGQLHYLHEPFNPDHPIGKCITKIKFPHYMVYVTEEIDEYYWKYYKPMKKLLAGQLGWMQGFGACNSIKDIVHVYRRRKEFLRYSGEGKPALIKDPIAIFSAGWLARAFNINVIVMIRHPAGVVASMKRLNWSFDPLNWALSQPLLLRDYLSPFKDEMIDIVESNADIIDRAALLWKIVYFVVTKYQKQYPDWLFLRHEDAAIKPLRTFEKLYWKFGLNFSDDVKVKIHEFTNEGNPSHNVGQNRSIVLNSKKVIEYWKNALSADEILRIRKRVEEVSQRFYRDEDWDFDTAWRSGQTDLTVP